MALALHLHYREHLFDCSASTPLLLFWLGTIILGLVRLRTSVATGLIGDNSSVVIGTFVHLLAALGAFAMECRTKPNGIYILSDDYDSDNNDGIGGRGFRTPEKRANIFSRMVFAWMTPLLKTGYRRPLKMDDLFGLDTEYYPGIINERFQRNWQAELKSGRPSLLRANMRTYKEAWMLAGLADLLANLVSLLNPILLSRLIGFVSKYGSAEAEPIEYGYFYAFSMFFSQILSVCWAQSQRIKCQMQSGFSAVLYRKSIKLSNESRQKYDMGGVVMHMTVDAKRILNFIGNQSHYLWTAPLHIALVLCMLYKTLGWSMLAGVAIMLISIPTSSGLSRSMQSLNTLLMGYRDQRMKIMDEVLSGIKIIKLYAWETSFIRRINDVRVRLELSTIRRYGAAQATFSFVVTLIPFAVSFSTFGLYSLADNKSHGPLTPQLVFVSLTLFNMLRTELSHGPSLIPGLLEAIVSHRRIFDFLTAGEIDFEAVDHGPYDRDAPDASRDDVLASVKGGTFRWLSANAQPTLSNINIECKRSELVAVIGRVGSGKSSLASAILGEMVKSAGSVTLCGSVAYVPQQPWIMNATLRDNILFGHRFEQEFYDKVIDACALGPDLEMLPGGDTTEIGEKGINLSGGQKARVSLARAVYSRADVYILDDPLAAVDAHVGKHIFTHVLGPQGLLKTRARILVTNAVQYLSNTDQIVMLSAGAIVDRGPFARVIANRGEIYEFVHKYIEGEGSSLANSGESGSASDTEHYEDKITQNKQDGMPEPLGVCIFRKSTKQTLGRASIGTIHEAMARRRVCGNGSNSPQDTTAGALVTANNTGRTMTTEVSRQGKVEWDIYCIYAKACGMRNVAMFGVAILLGSASNVLANMWLKHWASSNTEGKDSAAIRLGTDSGHSVFYYLLTYGVLGFLGALVNLVRSLILWTRCSVKASENVHRHMLLGVLRSPVSFFDVTPLGRILNRFSSDLRECDEALPRAISELVHMVANVLSAILVIVFTMPFMLVIIMPLAFAYRYLQQLYLFSSREVRRLDSTTRSPVISHFQDSVGGISTIRAYSQQSRFIAENNNRLETNMRSLYTYFAINRWLFIRLEILCNVVILGTTTLAIVLLQYYGYGDAGLVGLSIMYALDVTSSLNWSVRNYTEIENSMIQLERVVEYARLPSEASVVIEDNCPAQSWPEQGMVEFKNYSTRYREGLDLVLRDLSFCVLPKQKVGIVGRTGAGKSSLTLTLFRIIEAAGGQILIDGEDIAQYGLYDVRSKLSIIPQDPVLFAGTVRENLDPFNSYSDQEIWCALEHAHLGDFVRSKNKALEYMVTQGGENFSVGQRQLICLARALLKRAKVLVLDEATAAIDNSTDSIIQKSIRKEFNDCTVLTIAHRLNTIIDSDMILVIDGGKLAEYNTPGNLLADKTSLFAKLVEEARNNDSQ
ncbi:hypothetical protein LPJ66_003952 [Kickxella alabastrina]|uniref:Uncharacterized protein n=1 Tax=Kickxella alabastrina TaxID=61397 RepID=A0ACC1IJB0_9FUNG|nr:hypothetical protein LPJ66_003952 [Kickxella alabastrina]